MPSVPNSGPAAPPPPVWDARPPGAQRTGYGGFWIRAVAYVIDLVLLNIVLGVIGSAIGFSLLPADSTKVELETLASQMGSVQLVALVVTWLYFALMESSARGATLGKMALGLRVVNEQGERISFLNATGRFFAKIISSIILFIGYIMVAFTDRKRGLHDMIAGTVVIKVR